MDAASIRCHLSPAGSGQELPSAAGCASQGLVLAATWENSKQEGKGERDKQINALCSRPPAPLYVHLTLLQGAPQLFLPFPELRATQTPPNPSPPWDSRSCPVQDQEFSDPSNSGYSMALYISPYPFLSPSLASSSSWGSMCPTGLCSLQMCKPEHSSTAAQLPFYTTTTAQGRLQMLG